jgi:DNA invertase Pin-like site-specific DNA recombinase
VGELIGYAWCSTVLQDLTARREILASLGVPPDRIYLDKGLTGTTRAWPRLNQALAAVRAGDTLVVPELDRLARSVPTPATSATPSSPAASACPSAAPSTTPATLLKMRTRKGMATARARGKLKGKQPKLTARQQAQLVRMQATGEHTVADLIEVLYVGRVTIYRVLNRAATSTSSPAVVPGPSPNTPA